MKKSIKMVFGYAAMVLMVCFATSCSEDFDEQGGYEPELETTTKTCPMVFNGEVVSFDQEEGQSTTRAASSSWNDGDVVYIVFYNGTTKVPGMATYSSTQGWNVSYDGDIAIGTGVRCEVRYFVNATFANESLVTINSNTEIYETIYGTYDFNGNTLMVQASMTPKTGRIRFSGTSGDKIHLTGISVYTTYAPALNKFSSTESMIATTVADDGYTPYIYGSLSDSDRKLGLIGSDFAYTRTCSEAVLEVGDSGYMAIPSESSHNNWRSGLYVTARGVEFKMIPVAGHSSGFFLIGETEVTKGLYYKVTGNTSTSNLNYPISNIRYDTFYSFITELNYQTNLTFSLPNASQWTYAAKGGKMSQGYTYSGGNNPGDVAWYEGNSNGSIHPVKQLAPNELGIYDMSGNVEEVVYKTSAFSDGYYSYGGSYADSESAIKTNSNRNDYDNAYSDRGFRLKLTCN